MNSIKRFAAPTLLVTLLTTVIIQLAFAAGDRFDALAWFDPIQDVLLEVRRDYVEELDAKKYSELQKAAIDGMLEELGDPYTVYIPPAQQEDFDKSIRGRYVGIGAEVRLQDGWLTIRSPMAGSPAIRAGIRAGDQVRAIDGQTTLDESIDESISRLMGEPNTPVVLTVHREAAPEDETIELTVIRGPIHVSTVEGVHRVGEDWDFWLNPDSRIAYIRIRQFTETTSQELRAATSYLVDNGLAGLILDLRFNPGGSLGAAIEVSDLFLRDAVIVSVRGRSMNRTYRANDLGTLPDFPMMVMVNAQSASASEIVAGALQDNDRALVLGTRSFGKGLVQDVKPLRSGAGQIKITTASYFLPSDRNLHKWPDSETWGVDPNPGFFVPMTNDDYRTMLEIRSDLSVIRNQNEQGQWSDSDWVADRLKDEQTALALEAIQGRLASGHWPAVGQTLDPDSPLVEDLRLAERQRDFLIEQLEQVQERLNSLASLVPAEEKEPIDLLPDDIDLANGVIQVRDAQGNIIATLRITDSANLESALRHADLTPEIDDTEEN